MKIELKILRYSPETDQLPGYQSYQVEAAPDDRILDALVHIQRFVDPTLSFRKSCAHGVCGSDGMRINGKDRLACKTLVKDVLNGSAPVTIEPLAHFPVQKDLIVDLTLFFEKYRSVKPFLINDEPVAAKERIQTPDQHSAFDDTTLCILCAVCYSACPVLGRNDRFLGPAALVQASRFLHDSRDKGLELRRPALDDPDGARACENRFECTRSCPRSIKVTRRINEIKRKLK
ncbi:MAG: succinate dehydrogenase iron-sulfur subunit [Desulfobacterales bacterium]|nr:succinate dehydrogenase iron-sulfur subunit [Desulfobacterales bacterium]